MKVRVSSQPEGESQLNRITHKSFRPYTQAIGETAVAWNDLQENLAFLFLMVVQKEATNDRGMALTLWHCIDNDRLQRKLLINATLRIWQSHSISHDALKEIQWLKAEADKLSDARNDAIHSPIYSMTAYRNGVQQIYVGPYPPWHPRAEKLAAKKDVLAELRRCRDTAAVLSQYSLDLASAVGRAKRPEKFDEPTLMTLPGRPKLPNRGQKSRPRPRSKAIQPK